MRVARRVAGLCLTASVGLLCGISGAFAQTENAATREIAKMSELPLWTPSADIGDYRLDPPYSNASELTAKDGVPKGTVYRFVMDSKDSKLFPGIAKNAPGQTVPYQRRVTVYIPNGYKPGTPAPFFVSQDSLGQGVLPTILDNMISEKRLPALVGIMIDSGGGDSFGSERGLEYDTMSGKYAEFIETEVLPRITKDYQVTFTKNPDGRMTMGGSSGGAAALSMAWYHPDLYHRVLSYSGTFVNQQSPLNPETPGGAWEYHNSLIPKSKRKPLRIWMHVGDNDLRSKDEESTLHNWVLANERTAAVLKAKKYPYQFVFARQSGHVDGRVVNQTLPAALEWVWKGYKSNRR